MAKEIKLVFIGNRANGDGSLAATFIEDKKSDSPSNHLHFKKGQYIIGRKYLGEKDGDRISLFTKKALNEFISNDTLTKKWASQDKAAIAEAKDIRAKEKIGRFCLSNSLKSELKTLTQGLTTKEVSYLVEEIVYEIRQKEDMENLRRRLNLKVNKNYV